MAFDVREFIQVPPVVCEVTVTEENAAEVSEWLGTRQIQSDVDEAGISWTHPAMGTSRVDFGGDLVVLRDGLALAYGIPLTDQPAYQEVQAGETGRVALLTEPR